MNPGFWQRLDLLARRSAPAAVAFLLVLVGVTPLQIPAYGPVAPQLILVAIYFWAIHRPELMPLTVVFALGLLQDVLTGAPVGLSSFCWLLVHWLVAGQRRVLIGKPFLILWCAFLIVALSVGAVQWLLFSLLAGMPTPIAPVFFQSLTTTAIYPVLAWLLVQVQRGFLGAAT